jgi:hypothetical protein
LGDELKEDQMDGACGTNGAKRTTHRLLVTTPEGERPLDGPRYRWAKTVQMDVKKLDVRIRTGFIWLRVRITARFL